jgi:hypothetical protein
MAVRATGRAGSGILEHGVVEDGGLGKGCGDGRAGNRRQRWPLGLVGGKDDTFTWCFRRRPATTCGLAAGMLF